jgi:isoquinoline 1-oxidoreductase
VLVAAADKFGWGKTKAGPARGFGLACGVEKGGYVASCAEVSISQPESKVKIERIVMAFECGAIVNPEHLKNQVEGSAIMAIGATREETRAIWTEKFPRFHGFNRVDRPKPGAVVSRV